MGSEMCIRDRCRRVAWCSRCARRPWRTRVRRYGERVRYRRRGREERLIDRPSHWRQRAEQRRRLRCQAGGERQRAKGIRIRGQEPAVLQLLPVERRRRRAPAAEVAVGTTVACRKESHEPPPRKAGHRIPLLSYCGLRHLGGRSVNWHFPDDHPPKRLGRIAPKIVSTCRHSVNRRGPGAIGRDVWAVVSMG